MKKQIKPNKNAIILVSSILIIITLATNFYGGADILDYSDGAKYLGGEYAAKIRSSHSYMYSLLHALPVVLTDSFLIFKITSLISLFLIVYSVYIISNKDKRALWLMLLSPILWYMAPWISPIQLASLLFLWAYYFIRKYDESSLIKYLFYSGLLIGLSWAFWDGVLFFFPLLIISFMYDKKLLHTLSFIIFIFIGIMPRLILDQILFGFAFFGILRHVFASLTIAVYGGVYNQGSLAGISKFTITIIFIPLYSYLFFSKEAFKENKKTAIFMFLSTIIILFNSQIRFVLIIAPIVLVSLVKRLTKKSFITHIALSLILILLVINPYLIQIKYDTNFNEFTSTPLVYNKLEFDRNISRALIEKDVIEISKEYPNQTFVVGDNYESYRFLANAYWGDEIKEFVSIEDYRLYLSNSSVVFEKAYCPNIKVNERREICSSIYIKKTSNDQTNYGSIQYAISDGGNIDLKGFELIKRYRLLSIYKKV